MKCVESFWKCKLFLSIIQLEIFVLQWFEPCKALEIFLHNNSYHYHYYYYYYNYNNCCSYRLLQFLINLKWNEQKNLEAVILHHVFCCYPLVSFLHHTSHSPEMYWKVQLNTGGEAHNTPYSPNMMGPTNLTLSVCMIQ